MINTDRTIIGRPKMPSRPPAVGIGVAKRKKKGAQMTKGVPVKTGTGPKVPKTLPTPGQKMTKTPKSWVL